MRILRAIVDREQDFRSSDDYPDGFIRETLECGHDHIELIEPDPPSVDRSGDVPRLFPHSHNAKRRRCRECEKAAKRAARIRS